MMHTLAGINLAQLQLLSMGPRYVTCLAYTTQQSLHYCCFVHSNNPTPKSNHNGELPVPLFFSANSRPSMDLVKKWLNTCLTVAWGSLPKPIWESFRDVCFGACCSMIVALMAACKLYCLHQSHGYICLYTPAQCHQPVLVGDTVPGSLDSRSICIYTCNDVFNTCRLVSFPHACLHEHSLTLAM